MVPLWASWVSTTIDSPGATVMAGAAEASNSKRVMSRVSRRIASPLP